MIPAGSQVHSAVQTASSAAPEPQTILENEAYHVMRVDLDNERQIALPQPGHDVIVVVLGDGVSLRTVAGGKAESLAYGEVRFVDRNIHGSLLHAGTSLAQVLVVGLKQHWDAEIRPCTLPRTCSHPIRVGGQQIGQSESLFTNGFVTAYRDEISQGGTLNTSYYSKKGTHHLVLIALDDFRASFDGKEQELSRGQAFGSDADEVEIEADSKVSHPVEWIVIRLESGKL